VEVELRRERLHAPFKVLGAGTRLRAAALGVRKLLMGERQADAGGDLPRDGHIPEAEGVRLFLPECEVQRLEALWRCSRSGTSGSRPRAAALEDRGAQCPHLRVASRARSPMTLNPAAVTRSLSPSRRMVEPRSIIIGRDIHR